MEARGGEGDGIKNFRTGVERLRKKRKLVGIFATGSLRTGWGVGWLNSNVVCWRSGENSIQTWRYSDRSLVKGARGVY